MRLDTAQELDVVLVVLLRKSRAARLVVDCRSMVGYLRRQNLIYSSSNAKKETERPESPYQGNQLVLLMFVASCD
jgi:hypothetical protein